MPVRPVRTSARPVDGHDIRPILFGCKDAKSPWETLGYWRETELQAIRQGPWKLREVKGEIELYNLLEDISESRNLADEMPEKVAELHAVLTSLKIL